jgi:hypothetical protein
MVPPQAFSTSDSATREAEQNRVATIFAGGR